MDFVDPDVLRDRLPQPFRFLDKLARSIVDGALELVGNRTVMSLAEATLPDGTAELHIAQRLACTASVSLPPPVADATVTAVDVCFAGGAAVVVAGASNGAVAVVPGKSTASSVAAEWTQSHPEGDSVVSIASAALENSTAVMFASVSSTALRLQVADMGSHPPKPRELWGVDVLQAQGKASAVRLSSDGRCMFVAMGGSGVVLLYRISLATNAAETGFSVPPSVTLVGEIRGPSGSGILVSQPRFVPTVSAVKARPASGQQKALERRKGAAAAAAPSEQLNPRPAKTPPAEKHQQQPAAHTTAPAQTASQHQQQPEQEKEAAPAPTMLLCQRIKTLLVWWPGHASFFKIDFGGVTQGQTIPAPAEVTCGATTQKDCGGDVEAALGLADGGLLLLRTQLCIGKYVAGKGGPIGSVAFCGRNIATASQSGSTIAIREMPSGRPLRIVQCSAGGPVSLLSAPRFRVVVLTRGATRQQAFSLLSKGDLDSQFTVAGGASAETTVSAAFLPSEGRAVAFLTKKTLANTAPIFVEVFGQSSDERK